jgi:hypothetical protein
LRGPDQRQIGLDMAVIWTNARLRSTACAGRAGRKIASLLCALSHFRGRRCARRPNLTKLGSWCPYLWRTTLFKTFIAGIFLGVLGGGAALYFLPAVDLVREQSVIRVMPNGGNVELFHANLPIDRIMVGAPGQQSPLPDGLDWPDEGLLANSRTELFKIRNSRDIVVGVASRVAASNKDGDQIEWVMHLPARGSIYALMQTELNENGDRVGQLRAGTREFTDLVGLVRETWIVDAMGDDDAPAGRVELQARFVSVAEEEM